MSDKILLVIGMTCLCAYVLATLLFPHRMTKSYTNIRDTILRAAITGALIGGLTNCTRLVICNFVALMSVNIIFGAFAPSE
jgi:hypothetical protein